MIIRARSVLGAVVFGAVVLGASLQPATSSQAVSTVVENWGGKSSVFHRISAPSTAALVADPAATDGRALRLRLNPLPLAGPRHGVAVASTRQTYRYGRYATRMRTADCTGLDRPGVVTAAFTYAYDHSDANLNGMPDNDEIDIEVLCAQPEVIWMTLWTDYREIDDTPRLISRAVNLRTGEVLLTCYRETWTGACPPPLPGENRPTAVTAVPGFDSSARYHIYRIDWHPKRVVFSIVPDTGRRIVLWDYRGPANRIPSKPSAFLQSVWHTRNWDPLDGPARTPPRAQVSAHVDWTSLPDPLVGSPRGR